MEDLCLEAAVIPELLNETPLTFCISQEDFLADEATDGLGAEPVEETKDNQLDDICTKLSETVGYLSNTRFEHIIFHQELCFDVVKLVLKNRENILNEFFSTNTTVEATILGDQYFDTDDKT